jgi:hypothetical protein
MIRMACLLLAIAGALDAAEPWKRHAIDSTSRGADGVRFLDANGDGLEDIATGWEEGGVVRVYLNPGPKKAAEPWPAVTVGQVATPEDAFLVDLDEDGAVDVISFCEGKERAIYVHWAPRSKSDYLNSAAWTTEVLPASKGKAQWMFGTMMQVDGRRGTDLVAGAKNEGAQLGWFEAPANRRDLTAWKFHPIYDAGWIMSIEPHDMDGDGDTDILISERRGPKPGTLWLENQQAESWPVRRISSIAEEVLFLTTGDIDKDGLDDVVTAAKSGYIRIYRRVDRSGLKWTESGFKTPEFAGFPKGVAIGDLNLDGVPDIAVSFEQAKGPLTGVVSFLGPDFKPTNLGGPEGYKYDLVRLIDLDGDGDLDLVTTEEVDLLGVIWYENPAR